MSRRADLFIWLFGINIGEQFLITAPAIDANDFGYKLEPSFLRDMIVNTIVGMSYLHLVRPWFLALISLILLFDLVRRRKLTVALATLFLSGTFYAVGLVALGNAADARLLFHTNVISILFAAIALHRLQLDNKLRPSRAGCTLNQ
jgi:hypothetical protein